MESALAFEVLKSRESLLISALKTATTGPYDGVFM